MKSTPSLRFSLSNKTKRLPLLTLVSLVAVAALLGFAVVRKQGEPSREGPGRAVGKMQNRPSFLLLQDRQPNA